jgi:two-component system sensor histidine kinase KdpD
MKASQPPPQQRELVASIAHDLRSPLSVIAGVASRLREAVSPEVRLGLDRITEETQRATRMLENRMTVALLQTGESLPREWVSVEEVLGTALARLDARLGARAVRVDIAGDVEIHADPQLATLVLINVIDNAARHTIAKSAIDITARREGTQTHVEVADRGPGLTPAASRALEGQVVIDDAGAQRRGLAVCRAIVDAYDGTITAHARDGGGLVVRVVIPDAG